MIYMDLHTIFKGEKNLQAACLWVSEGERLLIVIVVGSGVCEVCAIGLSWSDKEQPRFWSRLAACTSPLLTEHVKDFFPFPLKKAPISIDFAHRPEVFLDLNFFQIAINKVIPPDVQIPCGAQ